MILPQYRPYLVQEIATTEDEHPTNLNLAKEAVFTFENVHSRKFQYEQGMKIISHSHAKDYCLRMCKARLAVANEKEDEKLLNLLDLSLDKVSGAVQEVASFNNIDFITKYSFLIIQGAVVAYLGQQALEWTKINADCGKIAQVQYEKENEDYQTIFKELKPRNDISEQLERLFNQKSLIPHTASPLPYKTYTKLSDGTIVELPNQITTFCDANQTVLVKGKEPGKPTYDPEWLDSNEKPLSSVATAWHIKEVWDKLQDSDFKYEQQPIKVGLNGLETEIYPDRVRYGKEKIAQMMGIDIGNQSDSTTFQTLTTKSNEDLTYVANAISAYGTDEQKEKIAELVNVIQDHSKQFGKEKTEQVLSDTVNLFNTVSEIPKVTEEVKNFYEKMSETHMLLSEIKHYNQFLDKTDKHSIFTYEDFKKSNYWPNNSESKYIEYLKEKKDEIKDLVTAPIANKTNLNSLAKMVNSNNLNELVSEEKVEEKIITLNKLSDYLIEDSKFRKERNAKVINGETKSAFHRKNPDQQKTEEARQELNQELDSAIKRLQQCSAQRQEQEKQKPGFIKFGNETAVTSTNKWVDNFLESFKKAMDEIPKHTGKDIKGIDAAIAYLDKVDAELKDTLKQDILPKNIIESAKNEINNGKSRLLERKDLLESIQKLTDNKKSISGENLLKTIFTLPPDERDAKLKKIAEHMVSPIRCGGLNYTK